MKSRGPGFAPQPRVPRATSLQKFQLFYAPKWSVLNCENLAQPRSSLRLHLNKLQTIESQLISRPAVCLFDRRFGAKLFGAKYLSINSGTLQTVLQTGVARFFLVQNTKTGKIIPNYHKLFEMSIKYNKRP
jgi:hypothetical protein